MSYFSNFAHASYLNAYYICPVVCACPQMITCVCQRTITIKHYPLNASIHTFNWPFTIDSFSLERWTLSTEEWNCGKLWKNLELWMHPNLKWNPKISQGMSKITHYIFLSVPYTHTEVLATRRSKPKNGNVERARKNIFSSSAIKDSLIISR